MIEQNSGLIFRVPLKGNIGYGFSQLIDFTDEYDFDGLLAITYDLFVRNDEKTPSVEIIEQSNKLLGPFCLQKFPNSRGKGAWKKLGSTPKLFYHKFPQCKIYRGLLIENDNWAELNKWFVCSEYDVESGPVPYENVRHLESSILMSNEGVADKLSMYKLIIDGKKLDTFYNLDEFGYKSLFVELVNTYFDEERCNELLEEYLS